MLIAPYALSSMKISRSELADDKKKASSYGNCALGKEAVYLGWWSFSNARYIPLKKVERVFKRLAVSKGYYKGGIFGTLSYLVVIHDGGRETQCLITHEEDVDRILEAFRKKTHIPVGK